MFLKIWINFLFKNVEKDDELKKNCIVVKFEIKCVVKLIVLFFFIVLFIYFRIFNIILNCRKKFYNLLYFKVYKMLKYGKL